MSMLRWISLLVLSVSSCASVSTTVAPPPGDPLTTQAEQIQDGLIYYMPRRGFKIVVSVDKDGGETASVVAGDAIPDFTRRYILRYGRNWVGTNHGTLGVNSRGLLQNTSSTTTSATNTIATAIGTIAGDVTALAASAARQQATPRAADQLVPCKIPNTTYSIIIFPEDLNTPRAASICDFRISGGLTPASLKISEVGADSVRLQRTGEQAGIFYKHDLPYIITITDRSDHSSAWLVYSPDQSPVTFFPVTGGVFANASSSLSIVDGALTQADVSTDSEIVGLLQFPANVISGYFAAIGQIFQARGNDVSQQNSLEANRQALSKTEVQLQACRATIQANDVSGKTADALTAAMANIRAAC
jgi:hypothetical protein